MDLEKLYSLSCTIRTWSDFVLQHATTTTEYSSLLSHECSFDKKFCGTTQFNYLLRCYKNQFYYLKNSMEDLILKYKELEKFCNENNINGG